MNKFKAKELPLDGTWIIDKSHSFWVKVQFDLTAYGGKGGWFDEKKIMQEKHLLCGVLCLRMNSLNLIQTITMFQHI